MRRGRFDPRESITQEAAIFDLRELTGVVPPLVTPFTESGDIDAPALREEIRYMIDTGVTGIVIGGSTGEGAGLSEDDVARLVEVSMEAAEGRVPILAGVVTNDSPEAIRVARRARDAGACGLQVPPPHFCFTTEPRILEAYYRAITDATGLPLIIYNVIPWAQLALRSLEKLVSNNPQIVGIKQSGGNINALADLCANLKGRVRIFTAIDDMLYPSFLMGADGTISGTSSVLPEAAVELIRLVEERRFREGLELHERLLPVWRSIEGSDFPSRVKFALRVMGRTGGFPRSPFGPPTPEVAARIQAELRAGGFIALRPRLPAAEHSVL
ncbi:MAG: dihydrodipicolinate synthase family protein [Bryobacterales bacterium]|nr:dihydrodipicolinate synthase family protein [Bryobacterales bacterium]MEB2362483.1 dihydrodipicolinate synthase family protein [Bryobacterales bacterium]